MSNATSEPQDRADPAGPPAASSTGQSESFEEMISVLVWAMQGSKQLREKVMAMFDKLVRDHHERSESSKQAPPEPVRQAVPRSSMVEFITARYEKNLRGLSDDLISVNGQAFIPWLALRALRQEGPSRSRKTPLRGLKGTDPRSWRWSPPVQQGAESHSGHDLDHDLASPENEGLDPRIALLKAASRATVERMNELRITILSVLAFEREQEQEWEMTEREREYIQRCWAELEDLLKRVEGLASTLEDPAVSQTEEITACLEHVELRVQFLYGMFSLETAKLLSCVWDDWKFPGKTTPEIAGFHTVITLCNAAMQRAKVEGGTKPDNPNASKSSALFDAENFILESNVADATRTKHGMAARAKEILESFIKLKDDTVSGSFKGPPKALPNKPATGKHGKSNGSTGYAGSGQSESKAPALEALDTLIVNMSDFVKAAAHGNHSLNVPSTAMGTAQHGKDTATTYFSVPVPTNLPASVKLALQDLQFVKLELKEGKQDLIDLVEQVRTILELELSQPENHWQLCTESLRQHPCALEYEHRRKAMLALMISWGHIESKLHKFAYGGEPGNPRLSQKLLKALNFLPSQGSKTPEQIWDEQYDRLRRLARPVDDLIDAYHKLRTTNDEQTHAAAIEQFGDWWTILLNTKASAQRQHR